jgi:hypothetical protein
VKTLNASETLQLGLKCKRMTIVDCPTKAKSSRVARVSLLIAVFVAETDFFRRR